MKHSLPPNKQRGAALMVALMFLVVLTMLGLAAVRATTQQTRMAAAMQFQSSAFHAAESAVRQVMTGIFNALTASPGAIPAVLLAASTGVTTLACDANPGPALPAPPVLAPLAVTTTLRLSPGTVDADGNPLTNCGNCSGGPPTGFSAGAGFTVTCFDLEGGAVYGTTGAGSVHQQRISRIGA